MKRASKSTPKRGTKKAPKRGGPKASGQKRAVKKARKPAAAGARSAPGSVSPEVVPRPVRMPLPPRVLFANTTVPFHALQETLSAGDHPPSRFGLGRALVQSRGQDRIGLVKGAIGGAASAIVLEEAIEAGAHDVLILTTAVGLSPRLPIGELIVPTEAVSAEGTSAHYLAKSAKRAPDARLRSALQRVLAASGLTYASGRVLSTDGYYRQTEERLQAYRRARYLAFDMELAALFAAAKFRQIRAAALVVISDSVATEPFQVGSDKPVFLNSLVRAARALAGWATADLGPEG